MIVTKKVRSSLFEAPAVPCEGLAMGVVWMALPPLCRGVLEREVQ